VVVGDYSIIDTFGWNNLGYAFKNCGQCGGTIVGPHHQIDLAYAFGCQEFFLAFQAGSPPIDASF
jgi:hypothetical protein